MEPRGETAGPHEMRMQQSKARNVFVDEMLKSVQKRQYNLEYRKPEQDGEKRVDQIIKNVMNELGHGEKYETKEEQEKLKKVVGSRPTLDLPVRRILTTVKKV